MLGVRVLEGFSGVLSRVSRSIVLESFAGAAFRFSAGWPEGRNAEFRDQRPWRVGEYAVGLLWNLLLCARRVDQDRSKGVEPEPASKCSVEMISMG